MKPRRSHAKMAAGMAVLVLCGLAIPSDADPPAESPKLDKYLRKYDTGDVILDYDQVVETFFILKSGSLTAEQREPARAENFNPYHRAKSTIKNPDWYGNSDSYFAAIFGFLGDPSFVRVTAAEPSELYVLPADMEQLTEISPEVANQLVKRLLRLVKKREKQIVDLRQQVDAQKN